MLISNRWSSNLCVYSARMKREVRESDAEKGGNKVNTDGRGQKKQMDRGEGGCMD